MQQQQSATNSTANASIPNSTENASPMNHFKQSLETLNRVLVQLKEERDYLHQNENQHTIHTTLFDCTATDTALTALVGLSYLALTATEMNLSNIMFIDGE